MTTIVAVYRTSQSYGGPEEGGWYYTQGYLIRKAKRFKGPHQLQRARRFAAKLNDHFQAFDRKHRIRFDDTRLSAKVFTGAPVSHFPLHRPHYE